MPIHSLLTYFENIFLNFMQSLLRYGDYLTKPMTEKKSFDGENNFLKYGVSSMQGWRLKQEDAHNCCSDFDTDIAYFAVYDGHGGCFVSSYAARELPKFLKNQKSYQSGNYETALINGFLEFDASLWKPEVSRELWRIFQNDKKECKIKELDEIKKKRQNTLGLSSDSFLLRYFEAEINQDVDKMLSHYDWATKLSANKCGCTAVVALVTNDKIYIANAGDSRAVLCRNGKAVDLSKDHSPLLETEHKRIEDAGSFVNSEGRIAGQLNLSRALGDLQFKKNKNLDPTKQIIAAYPDVITESIKEPENEFMILACDGIWECMSSQSVVDFVKPLLDNGTQLSKICEKLFDTIISKDVNKNLRGGDNMTMIIVQFKNKKNECFNCGYSESH